MNFQILKRSTMIALAGFSLALALNACNTTPPVVTPAADALEAETRSQFLAIEASTFVGKIPGTNAFIAVVDRAGEVQAYICDGTSSSITVSQWFHGSMQNGQLIAQADDGTQLTGTVTGRLLTGSVLVGKVQRSFTAADVEEPSGLWIADEHIIKDGQLNALEDITLFGWIRLPDGTQRGGAQFKDGVEITGPIDVDGLPSGTGPTVAPTNQDGGTADGGLGLCAMYQASFKGASGALKRGVRNVAERNRIAGIRDRALMLYNAECASRFGPITGADLPDNAQ